MSCSKRNDVQSGVFEVVGIFDARKRWLMNELARHPLRGSAQPTCRSYPFVRQFARNWLNLSVLHAQRLRPFLRLVSAFHRGRCVDVESCCWWRAGIQGSKSCAALAEAFDHADVSLVNLLNSDGDAAPIGADVEVIERVNVLLRLRTTRNVCSQFFAIV